MMIVGVALCLVASNPTGGGPWVDGPDAPVPDTTASTAPREPGAQAEPLAQPERPPEASRPLVDTGVPAPAPELRFATLRQRAELVRFAALDVEDGLWDVPGLWWRHEQAGAAQPSMRGLSREHFGVLIDDVPLLTLGGLIDPMEVLTVDGAAQLDVLHGPRVLTPARGAAGGVLQVRTAPPLRNLSEDLRADGVLAAGIAGPDLEKGVVAVGQSGWGRSRVLLHGSLINREDQRQGRSFVPILFAEPVGAANAGVLVRSGGNGGAAGIRADVMPLPRLVVFQSWHSARAVEAPRPARCQGSDEQGRPLDCTRTVERGADLWIAGGDAALDVFGVDLVLRPRVSIQRAVAFDERSGSGFFAIERVRDSSIGGTAQVGAEAILPRLALLDVWQPRVTVLLDGSREVVSSQAFSRSLRGRDAEPPGDGSLQPLRSRLIDGAQAERGGAALGLRADGQVASLALEGRLSRARLTATDTDSRLERDIDATQWAPEGALSGAVRLSDALSLFFAAVHSDEPADLWALRGPELGDSILLAADPEVARFVENALELGARARGSWFAVEGVVWGASRSGAVIAPTIIDDPFGRRELTRGALEQALGAEARAGLVGAVDGLAVDATAGAWLADEGALFDADARTARPGVLNPLATLLVSYAPPGTPFGVYVRGRGILPHARLSPGEELDRTLCPELPSDEQRAQGVERIVACSGAQGGLLLDVGAHLVAGRLRLDLMGQNLLDREAKVRNEPLGSGGLAISALVSVGL